jgi:hypothetical protein
MSEDRYTNTPEDAAWFEQRRSDGVDDDRPSAAELAADEAEERRVQADAYDAVIRETYSDADREADAEANAEAAYFDQLSRRDEIMFGDDSDYERDPQGGDPDFPY